MAKSIAWKAYDAKFEVSKGLNNDASICITPESDENPFEPICFTISLTDIYGVVDVLNEIRDEIEYDRELEAEEKEVSNG